MKVLIYTILFLTPCFLFSQVNTEKVIIDANTDIFSPSTSDEGLKVEKTHTGNSDIPAILGVNTVSDYYGIGVQGVGGYIGVDGSVVGTGAGNYYAVSGTAYGNNSGTNFGVYATAGFGSSNYSLYALSQGGSNNFAGFFQGQVRINQAPSDDVYFDIRNNNGVSVLIVKDDDIVEVNRFKTNWYTEMDSIKTNHYTQLANVSTTGNTDLTNVTTSGTTDLEIENGKRINKATSMRYFIATSGVYPSAGSVAEGTLIGEIKLLPYNFTPGGWLPCEGQVLNIIDYQALFSLIGINYGGDGQTTFALPDMRNAVPHHN